MSDLSKLRVADDEREQLIDELREHAGAGRLTSEELEDRVGEAYKASTRADLDVLRADLPVSSTSVNGRWSSASRTCAGASRRRRAARWACRR